MARYFFDINDGVEIKDQIGRELEAGEILRSEALHVATSLMRAEASAGKELTLILTVRDEAGNTPIIIHLVCQIQQS